MARGATRYELGSRPVAGWMPGRVCVDLVTLPAVEAPALEQTRAKAEGLPSSSARVPDMKVDMKVDAHSSPGWTG